MRIVSFWAQGYRSLRDVRIDTDRPFNVFYGPNGAGKSNILAGMQALFDVVGELVAKGASFQSLLSLQEQHTLTRDDRCFLGSTAETRLGAALQTQNDTPFFPDSQASYDHLELEVTVFWAAEHIRFSLVQLRDTKRDRTHPVVERTSDGFIVSSTPKLQVLRELPRRSYFLIDAHRFSDPEEETHEPDALQLLRQGKLNEALYRAASDPDPTVRKRLKAFRALIEGEPLYRPPFDIVRDPATKKIDLREPVDQPAGPFGAAADLPVRMTGLGIVQLYAILAQLLLPGTRAVGIEEPEAHLHAPTTGRQLRGLFERVVSEGVLDQIFIATHSNVFDLDAGGYHDVRYDEERGTCVEWLPLHHMDQHLWEPGPAMRALRAFLSSMGDEDIGLRAPDGSPITTSEMLDHLQKDDDVAEQFLRDIHATTVRMVMLKTMKRR